MNWMIGAVLSWLPTVTWASNMAGRFQLVSYNRGKWTTVLGIFGRYRPTLKLSTVVLPMAMDFGNGEKYHYETCLFSLDSSDSSVLERYETLDQAVIGHEKWRMHALK